MTHFYPTPIGNGGSLANNGHVPKSGGDVTEAPTCGWRRVRKTDLCRWPCKDICDRCGQRIRRYAYTPEHDELPGERLVGGDPRGGLAAVAPARPFEKDKRDDAQRKKGAAVRP
jgi:hypothetical protein